MHRDKWDIVDPKIDPLNWFAKDGAWLIGEFGRTETSIPLSLLKRVAADKRFFHAVWHDDDNKPVWLFANSLTASSPGSWNRDNIKKFVLNLVTAGNGYPLLDWCTDLGLRTELAELQKQHPNIVGTTKRTQFMLGLSDVEFDSQRGKWALDIKRAEDKTARLSRKSP